MKVLVQSKMRVRLFPGRKSYGANVFSGAKLTGAAGSAQAGGLRGTGSLGEPPTGGRTRKENISAHMGGAREPRRK